MNIVVCIKQVPNTTDVKTDPKTGTIIRQGVPSIINPDDKHALEAGLSLREEYGGRVTALTMGPRQAEHALREALAMGVDEAILLTDLAFAGADTYATAFTLALAIRKLESYDLIICGREASDGNTAQVGPQLAECLGIPQITYVSHLELISSPQGVGVYGRSLKEPTTSTDGVMRTSPLVYGCSTKEPKGLVARRNLEYGYEMVETSLPALITVVKELNKPRYPSVWSIVSAFREREITYWGIEELGADKDDVGLRGSRTRVRKTYTPQPKGEIVWLDGPVQEVARTLVDKFKAMNLI